MAGVMSRCPFWSTERENIECYSECPIKNESFRGNEDEHCIFHECSESIGVNFREIIKEDYDFLNLSIYDDEKSINIGY